MRGDDQQTGWMLSYVSPEDRVPADHPLRAIRRMTDKFESLYQQSVPQITDGLIEEARRMHAEEKAHERSIAERKAKADSEKSRTAKAAKVAIGASAVNKDDGDPTGLA